MAETDWFLRQLALYPVQNAASFLCNNVKTDLKTADTKRNVPKQIKRYFEFSERSNNDYLRELHTHTNYFRANEKKLHTLFHPVLFKIRGRLGRAETIPTFTQFF
jgi:hypothetical protein